ALEPWQPSDVDQRLRRPDTELEEGQQALAAGQDLGARGRTYEAQGFLDGGRALVRECRRDHAWPPFASWMARHTVCGVYGMSRWRMPSGLSASITALATAGRLASRAP